MFSYVHKLRCVFEIINKVSNEIIEKRKHNIIYDHVPYLKLI